MPVSPANARRLMIHVLGATRIPHSFRPGRRAYPSTRQPAYTHARRRRDGADHPIPSDSGVVRGSLRRRGVGDRARGRIAVLLSLVVSCSLAMYSKPQESVAHTPHPTNGCSAPITGNTPGGFNFKSACDIHDVCYGHRPFGASIRGRWECDRWFYVNMAAVCYRQSAADARYCYPWARFYFDMVRYYGCYPFVGRDIYYRYPCSDRTFNG